MNSSTSALLVISGCMHPAENECACHAFQLRCCAALRYTGPQIALGYRKRSKNPPGISECACSFCTVSLTSSTNRGLSEPWWSEPHKCLSGAVVQLVHSKIFSAFHCQLVLHAVQIRQHKRNCLRNGNKFTFEGMKRVCANRTTAAPLLYSHYTQHPFNCCAARARKIRLHPMNCN